MYLGFVLDLHRYTWTIDIPIICYIVAIKVRGKSITQALHGKIIDKSTYQFCSNYRFLFIYLFLSLNE